MRSSRAAALCLSLVMLSSLGCATKADVAALRAENVALRDSLAMLWQATEVVARSLVRLDTVPPPRCPPICFAEVVQGFPAAPR